MSTEQETDRETFKKIFKFVKRGGDRRKKNSYLKLIVLVLLALGGGSLYYLMKKPSKKKKKRRKRKEKEECDEQNGLYECIYRNLINWYTLETKELFPIIRLKIY